MAQLKVPTRQSSKADLNSFNVSLHTQPWYQQWLQSQHQDPSRVKLSDAQRKDLETVAAQHGVNLQGLDGMNFDPSANLNTPHGFASQPTWAKALEIGAPIAAGGYFAAPALFGGAGAAGSAGAAASAAPAAAAGTTAAGTGAGTMAATAGSGGGILGKLGNLFGGKNPMGNLLVSGGLGMLEGAMAPKPQVRQSFAGSSADPTKMLTESNDMTRGLFDSLKSKLGQPPIQMTTPTAPGMASGNGLLTSVGIPTRGVSLRAANPATPGMADPYQHMMDNLKLLGVNLG